MQPPGARTLHCVHCYHDNAPSSAAASHSQHHQRTTDQLHQLFVNSTHRQSRVGRPFVKRFTLCYRTVFCLSVTLVYCGQTVGWIKMPLGTELGLGPGDIVLDWHPAPPAKGHSTPTFRPMSIVAKRSPISATAELLFLYCD